MNEKEMIIKFAQDVKNEFFFRLKDETKPAKKEFSYIDLLDILDVVYKEHGITKQDLEKYEDKVSINDIFETLDPTMKEIFLKSLKDENIKIDKN